MTTTKDALNVPRIKTIEEAFAPIDEFEFIDLEEDEDYQREVWMFGERNL